MSSAIVIFGEVLFDTFPDGRRALGGAPFNVAWGLQGFGQQPLFCSAVGDDAAGAYIRQSALSWGLSTKALQVHPFLETGEVRAELIAGEPRYDIRAHRAWDRIDDTELSATQWLYHGSLALRDPHSRETFTQLARRSTAQRFFDVNLRPPYDTLTVIQPWLSGLDWLKLNLDELAKLLVVPSLSLDEAPEAIDVLRSQYGVRNVLLTAGKQGAQIQGEIGLAQFRPAPEPSSIVDTVGAGDAFSAVTLHGLISGWPLEQIISAASHFAARVCAQAGATSTDKAFYQLPDHA